MFPSWLAVVFWFSLVYLVTSESLSGHYAQTSLRKAHRVSSPENTPHGSDQQRGWELASQDLGPEPRLPSARHGPSLWPGPEWLGTHWGPQLISKDLPLVLISEGLPFWSFGPSCPHCSPALWHLRHFTFAFYPALLAALGLECELTAQKENCTG